MELAFAGLHLCAPLLEPLDGAFARRTFLGAWLAAAIAGRFAGAGELHEVARAARSARPPAGVPGPSDLLLDGLVVLVTEGRAEAAPLSRRSSAGLCRRRDHQRGAAAVVGTGRDGGEHGVGRRALARDRGPPCPVLTRGGLAGPAGAFGEWDGDYHGLAWRFRGGCFAGRGGGGDRGRDRDPVRPLRGRVARRIRGVQAEAAPLIEAVTTDARTGARAEASNGRSGYLPSCTTDSAATTGPGPGAAGPASRRLSCTPPWGHWLS